MNCDRDDWVDDVAQSECREVAKPQLSSESLLRSITRRINWAFIAFSIVVSILLFFAAAGPFDLRSAATLVWLLTIVHAAGCTIGSTADDSLNDADLRFCSIIFAIVNPPYYWYWAWKNPMKYHESVKSCDSDSKRDCGC